MNEEKKEYRFSYYIYHKDINFYTLLIILLACGALLLIVIICVVTVCLCKKRKEPEALIMSINTEKAEDLIVD